MPEAYGTFKRVSANRIQAQFEVDGIDRTYDGDINPAMPDFSSRNARVTYDSPEDLTETRSFDGQITKRDYNINLDNGVTFKGDLDHPIEQASTVDGRGQWTQNY
jgi:hypothetical protein